MVDASVALDIQFIDPPGDLDVGEKYRFRVVKRGSIAQNHNVEISQLDFVFRPLSWGQVEATDDPYVALLRVVELVDSQDIYDIPDYSVAAMLKAQGATVLRPRRQSRMATRRVEIELLFLHGFPGNFERFDPLRAVQPLDPQRGFRLASERQRIVVREGRIYLQCDSIEDLRSFVECKLPNGETVSCDLETLIDSGAAWQSSEPYVFPIYEQRRQEQNHFQIVQPTRSVRLTEQQHDYVSRTDSPPPQEDTRLELAIDFIDAPGDMVPGDEIRFRVRLDDQAIDIRHLHFEFQPVVWASLEETADSKVGRLTVLDLPRPADIYDRPDYWINASLRAVGQNSLQPRRFIRLIPGEVHLELVFYHGHGDHFEIFNPLTAKRPLNIHEGVRVSHERFRPSNRENWLYLHFDRLCDLKSVTEVMLPNGEKMTLDLDSRISNGAIFRSAQQQKAQQQAQQHKAIVSQPISHQTPVQPQVSLEAPKIQRISNEDQVERGLKEKLRLLRSFIVSFHARKSKPMSEQAVQIKERISSRVKQTRDALKQYEGAKQRDFLKAFEECIEAIPDYLRTQATRAGMSHDDD